MTTFSGCFAFDWDYQSRAGVGGSGGAGPSGSAGTNDSGGPSTNTGGDGGSTNAGAGGSANAGGSGGSSCPQGETRCGASCVNLDSDGTHCGSCIKTCNGQTCANRECVPIEVVSGLSGPWGLALGGTTLYFLEPSIETVARVSTSGGAVMTVVPASKMISSVQPGDTRGIAVDGFGVYFISNGGGTVYRANLGGGGITAIGGSGVNPWAIAVGNQHVYFTFDDMAGSINNVLEGGGIVNSLALDPMPYFPAGITVDSQTNVYFTTNKGPGGTVQKANFSDLNSSTTLASDENHPINLVTDDTNVYWVSPNAGTVRYVPTAGGTVGTLAMGQNKPTDLIVVSGTVYFTNLGTGAGSCNDGSVMRVSVGGQPEVIASGRCSPGSIVSDGTFLYWEEQAGGGAIYKTHL